MIPDRPAVFLSAQDTIALEQWKSTENSEAYYLRVLSLQLQLIDNQWTFSNPIVIIQRACSHWQNEARAERQTGEIRGEASRQTHRTGEVASMREARTIAQSHSIEQHQGPCSQARQSLRDCFSEWRRFSEGRRAVVLAMGRCIVQKDSDLGKEENARGEKAKEKCREANKDDYEDANKGKDKCP